MPLSLSVVEQPERKRGRKRLYTSDAEKQAAYRARKESCEKGIPLMMPEQESS